MLAILTGLLFIFSGLIKANDPLGLAYKMQEFFEVWMKEGYLPSFMEWCTRHAIELSVFLITLEILAGLLLVLGIGFCYVSNFIFLLTLFFTFLTAYAHFSGKIKSCGCFGDCLPLTSQESFIKDLMLLVITGILLVFSKRIPPLIRRKPAIAWVVVITAVTIGLQYYILAHLPVFDCLPYRIGASIPEQMTPGKDYREPVYATEFQYKNIQTGTIENFNEANYPWEDTLHWEFVSMESREVEPAKNPPTIDQFSLTDSNGLDLAPIIFNDPKRTHLVIVRDIHHPEVKPKQIERFY
jgi:uncharacterized membrane protein YphA (DoxX/SURF4 family)